MKRQGASAILCLILVALMCSIPNPLLFLSTPVIAEIGIDGWYEQNIGVQGHVMSASAANTNVAWVVGSDPDGSGPIARKTIDGGQTWSSQSIGSQWLGDISVVDENVAWAVSNNSSVVYKTINGGTDWIAKPAYGGLGDVSALDDQTVWVCSENGPIYKTTNGGDTWVDQGRPTGYHFSDICACDANTAWAVGYIAGGEYDFFSGVILQTEDGGANWNVKEEGGVPQLLSVAAVDKDTAWVSGGCLSTEQTGIVLKTTDGGTTWSTQLQDADSNAGVFRSVSAIDGDTCWAVNYNQVDEGSIYKTEDGGTNWILQKTVVPAMFNSVSAVDKNTAWAAGADYTSTAPIVYKTTNGGWEKPDIASIAPTTIKIGEEITIEGASFTEPQGSSYVSFNGTKAVNCSLWSNDKIVCTVPLGASSGPVTVITPGGTSNILQLKVITCEFYFAEGCTRDSFSEWLCIQNPGDEEIAVNATYMLFGWDPLEATYPVPAHSRVSINVNEAIGPGQDVSVKLWSEDEFYPERPMYFNYKEGTEGYSWDGGHVSTGAASPGSDWYFAEGCTRDGFDEWLCIQNPNNEAVDVQVNYITANAYTQSKVYPAAANSRISVYVNGDVGLGQDVSVHVHCDDPIVVERPMYFNYNGVWTGGHVVMGTDSPKNIWYFAEGTTRTGFDEWLAVQNPNNSNAQLTVTFLKSDGIEQVETYSLGANSRWTLNVSEPLGMEVDSAMVLESTMPVVAERPMYFIYNDIWTGGHDVLGTSEPNGTWFFPEGCTREGFDEFICIANPGEEQANVTLTFMLGVSTPIEHVLAIEPHQRATVNVPSIIERGQDVSTMVSSDKPVVAERPMYFIYNNVWTGGHDVVGYTP